MIENIKEYSKDKENFYFKTCNLILRIVEKDFIICKMLDKEWINDFRDFETIIMKKLNLNNSNFEFSGNKIKLKIDSKTKYFDTTDKRIDVLDLDNQYFHCIVGLKKNQEYNLHLGKIV